MFEANSLHMNTSVVLNSHCLNRFVSCFDACTIGSELNVAVRLYIITGKFVVACPASKLLSNTRITYLNLSRMSSNCGDSSISPHVCFSHASSQSGNSLVDVVEGTLRPHDEVFDLLDDLLLLLGGPVALCQKCLEQGGNLAVLFSWAL